MGISITERTRSSPSTRRLRKQLSRALAPDRVLDSPSASILYGRDASQISVDMEGPVCFPISTSEVQAIVAIADEYDLAIVPRGAGTGLAGGAVPVSRSIVVSTMKMNQVVEIDPVNRYAWVEPGTLNLDLTRRAREYGLHFAPDPSSQQACTIGGNVANNSGGPHCLAYGVTSSHVLAIEVVLANGDATVLGGVQMESPGLDLRGLLIGSEGTLGIITKVAVRLTRDRPSVGTIVVSFDSPRAAASAVSNIIGSGIVPAALEVMDQRIVEAIENHVSAGFPTQAGAVLLAEVDGHQHAVEYQVAELEAICIRGGATGFHPAKSEEERARLWKGRKGAFGAVAQIAPDYYLHDTVVPRSQLPDVLDKVYEIADKHAVPVMNVFHAGDGNLHPLFLFDASVSGALEKVHAAAAEVIEISLRAGGVLSGEHGVGAEKQEFMTQMFSNDDLDHQARVSRAFDPSCAMNPGKVLPSGHGCADVQNLNVGAPKGA